MGEKGWGLIVAEASSFGSALRGLMGDELVFAVIMHSVQRSFSKTRSRSVAIVIPSLALTRQVEPRLARSAFERIIFTDKTQVHWFRSGDQRGGLRFFRICSIFFP
jgi:hypothetical protein